MNPEVHPEALAYPLMPDDELASLAEDIAANGQRDPIVLDQHGRLIDGRNRLEACHRAEVEPVFETINFADEDEIADYILSVNVEKRSLTAGQKAMFRATNLARQGKRRNGRWQRGSVDNGKFADIEGGWLTAMKKAGLRRLISPIFGPHRPRCVLDVLTATARPRNRPVSAVDIPHPPQAADTGLPGLHWPAEDPADFEPLCSSCRAHGVAELNDICWECKLLTQDRPAAAILRGAPATAPAAAGLQLETLLERVENLEARLQALGEQITELRDEFRCGS